MSPAEKQRLRKLLRTGVVLLGVGLAYAWFVRQTGLAIPCPVRLITGHNCPGCGVTRMCLALLRGDLSAAYAVNRGLFLVLPALAVLLGVVLYRYVRADRTKGLSRTVEHWLSWVLLVYLLGWGILRNVLSL